ncbi:MAG: sulfatase-like hydrolase/transferase [Firmicutes bacterium]|nr:sulfatase-like hydrolase/transferase [Bacillota bacterium]
MQAPNILLLMPDQHRGDWLPFDSTTDDKLGCPNLPVNMPNIKRLMENGATFVSAVTPSPLCAPARACLASGRRYEDCGVVNNGDDYNLKIKTFYSVLKDAGYNVGGVGKLDLHKKTHWWGLDGWVDDLETLGFTAAIDNAGKIDAIVSAKNEPKDPYMKLLYDKGLAKTHIQDMEDRLKDHCRVEPTPLPDYAYCDNYVKDNAIKLLNGFSKNKPWFLAVNFTGPHNPWDVTADMRSKWENTDFPAPVRCDESKLKKYNAIRQNYAAMLENIDKNIGEIISFIDESLDLDNTVIIYTSDHGEMLGDFNRFGKSLPNKGSINIPLIINGKGLKNGVFWELVELQDLAQTFIDLSGADEKINNQSKSLLPLLTGGTEGHREYHTSALEGWKMVSDGRYKLIKDENGYKLFDLANDPHETTDISQKNKSMLDELKKRL